MNRRTVLASSACTLLAACTGRAPEPIDTAAIEARWPPEGRFVDANGLRVHAWEAGAGQPVILLHGASGNLRDWSFDLGPRIAERRRAIAFDRPGLGYSDRPAERGGDPAVQARVLRAASRAMGIERPILVGHSWGAALAMAWALGDPDGVAGVVTISGAVMPWSESPMLLEIMSVDRLLVNAYMSYLRATADKGGIERFVARIFRPQEPPAGYIDHVGGPLALRPPTQVANRDDITMLNTTLRRQAPDYGRVRVPVEVISGTADPIIRPESQPIPFAKVLPDARLTLLDNVGHMAHHARPEALLGALDRLDPASA